MNIDKTADEWKTDIRDSDRVSWLTEEVVIFSQNWSF